MRLADEMDKPKPGEPWAVSEKLLAELVDGIAALVAQHQAQRARLPSVDWGTDTAESGGGDE